MFGQESAAPHEVFCLLIRSRSIDRWVPSLLARCCICGATGVCFHGAQLVERLVGATFGYRFGSQKAADMPNPNLAVFKQNPKKVFIPCWTNEGCSNSVCRQREFTFDHKIWTWSLEESVIRIQFAGHWLILHLSGGKQLKDQRNCKSERFRTGSILSPKQRSWNLANKINEA